MPTLIAVTLVWAFSFSFIGEILAPVVDPYIAVMIRMVLAFLLLLPFLRLKEISPSVARSLMLIGALQLGVMYLLLYHAFLYISVPEVLLFTIFTPLYITIIDEFLLNSTPIPPRWWLAAILSVLGAALIRFHALSSDFLIGFLLIQASNLCFAVGQVSYKRLPIDSVRQQIHHYALFFLGAVMVVGVATFLLADFTRIPTEPLHWGLLLWLGFGASGGGYLAWSIASKRVNIAQLATMNNALIPAGIIVNAALWRTEINWHTFLLGASIIFFSIWLSSYGQKRGR